MTHIDTKPDINFRQIIKSKMNFLWFLFSITFADKHHDISQRDVTSDEKWDKVEETEKYWRDLTR